MIKRLVLFAIAALMIGGCGLPEPTRDVPPTQTETETHTEAQPRTKAQTKTQDDPVPVQNTSAEDDAQAWHEYMRDQWKTDAEYFPMAKVVTESDYSIEVLDSYRELVIQTDYYPDSDFDDAAEWGCGALQKVLGTGYVPDVDNASFVATDGTRHSCGGE